MKIDFYVFCHEIKLHFTKYKHSFIIIDISIKANLTAE